MFMLQEQDNFSSQEQTDKIKAKGTNMTDIEHTDAYCKFCKKFTRHADVSAHNDYGQEAILHCCVDCGNCIVR